MNRREFLAASAAAAAALSAPGGWSQSPQAATPGDPFWGYLMHLGFNIWGDRKADGKPAHWEAQPQQRFDDALWTDLLAKMSECGVNLLVIDLADGVRYESHPEIAVEGAWAPARLREELARLRGLGIEPIPKLNFAASHDLWLKQYARQVSTDAYYRVCADLIAEVSALFDGPRWFHLGMDDESVQQQDSYQYIVCRQYDLWWKDLLFFVAEVEKTHVRPWVWADYCRKDPETYFRRMPKNVLQSNRYYSDIVDPADDAIRAFNALEQNGYEQAPTGSIAVHPDNFLNSVLWLMDAIPRAHIKGFLQTSWQPMLESARAQHVQALEQIARASIRYAAKAQAPAQV